MPKLESCDVSVVEAERSGAVTELTAQDSSANLRRMKNFLRLTGGKWFCARDAESLCARSHASSTAPFPTFNPGLPELPTPARSRRLPGSFPRSSSSTARLGSHIVERILFLRHHLRQHDVLGEYGPVAILRSLRTEYPAGHPTAQPGRQRQRPPTSRPGRTSPPLAPATTTAGLASPRRRRCRRGVGLL